MTDYRHRQCRHFYTLTFVNENARHEAGRMSNKSEVEPPEEPDASIIQECGGSIAERPPRADIFARYDSAHIAVKGHICRFSCRLIAALVVVIIVDTTSDIEHLGKRRLDVPQYPSLTSTTIAHTSYTLQSIASFSAHPSLSVPFTNAIALV